MASGDDVLDLFLSPVREWFRQELGKPTLAQQLGWPPIAAGQNTLILAPTGSGKTLAAFLACLDQLWRQDDLPRGVRILYISPLKALNNDIHRNLQGPLEGVLAQARGLGFPLPVIETGLRTGDTPTQERQRQLRKPPQVLITTPESLHLLLTSRGREMLRGVTHCIVDEIHALCGNKRGVFLTLLLERLQALTPRGFVRIGLSATQRPLEEVARFLGGLQEDASGAYHPRPVTIVDAGHRKNLDLKVLSSVDQFGPIPEKSVWPSIYRLLGEEVRKHRSTIVFANDRRSVERITANLNAEAGEEIARAHHGSVSLEVRQETEQALKEGRLPCVVSSASLELGIDMGAVDLVCQVASPGNIARGLQRVGRAGHLVGQTSKGRLIPRMASDLIEQAVLACEMTQGHVEPLRIPLGCLDILAQQIVAEVALQPYDVTDLYGLIRRAYPYRDLTPGALESVLEMVSGRFVFARSAASERNAGGRSTLDALQPRLSWDRIHHRLHALPGSQHMALVNGGTIPDTGQYAAYTPQGVRIGELDEEFVYERRVGDAFVLGTNTWRVLKIEADRVAVAPAEGAHAVMPFWRGEGTGRSADLGLAMGRFLRELRERIDLSGVQEWLEKDYFLEPKAARQLLTHVKRQLDGRSGLPTDQTLTVEASRDQLGDWQVILLSPFGGRVHFALRLAVEHRLRQRLGYRPQCLHHDDGLLVRQTESEEPLLDLLEGLTPENVELLVLEELAESALFALRFRQNAARALLLPRGQAGKRAPLWLQRLRGRDLLQVARQHPDFPVVIETYRECLHDHLDLPRLQELLRDIREGRIALEYHRRSVPSSFAGNILFSFTAARMYDTDSVETDSAPASLDKALLQELIAPEEHRHLLDPRAMQQVERRLRGLGLPPRSAAEMVERLRQVGDLSDAELEGPMAGFLEQLQAEGRAKRLELPGNFEPRWIEAEEEVVYRQAFGMEATLESNVSNWEGEAPAEPSVLGSAGASPSHTVELKPHSTVQERQRAASIILERFLRTHALVSLADILARYPFEPEWAERQLRAWAVSGRAVNVPPRTVDEAAQWSTPEVFDQVQRSSLGLLRREVLTCTAPQFADFLVCWQGVHPEKQRSGPEGLTLCLQNLQGVFLPAELWEQSILPARVLEYQPRLLDDWIAAGSGLWVAAGEPNETLSVAFLDREEATLSRSPPTESLPALTEEEQATLGLLHQRGACFLADLVLALQKTPSEVRNTLWRLMARSLVTNDRFDVIRRGRPEQETADPTRRPARFSLRRQIARTPEGRWSLLSWREHATPEEHAIRMANRLLRRYGVAARELALLDPWMPPWRILYEVLSRLELSGEVRRGYFAEGLSGAQFALPEAMALLQDQHLPSTVTAPVVLLHSLDPANMYGSGAPFDVALLEGGARSFLRRPGNWLTLRAGKPILLVEQHGKKVTALATASKQDIADAVRLLPSLCQGRGNIRHKLTVEEWNEQPVTGSAGRELLEQAGFVRDYQGMTLYATWAH